MGEQWLVELPLHDFISLAELEEGLLVGCEQLVSGDMWAEGQRFFARGQVVRGVWVILGGQGLVVKKL